MKTVRTLAVLVMVATVLAAVMGSYVRGMGAGLACPDWPLCHGRLIPPLDQQAVLLEWTHRMIVFVMGWLVLALLAITWRCRLQGRYLATVAFVFLLGQAILGGMTVLNRLHPLIVALHQGMEDDVVKMSPVSDGVEIPAGNEVTFRPGGYHRMLIGL